MNFSKELNENLDYIKKINNNSSDLNIRNIKIGIRQIGYVFLESTCSDDKISNYFMKNINTIINFNKNKFFNNLFFHLKNQISNSKLNVLNTNEDIFYYLASGFTIIFVDGVDKAIAIETKANLDRGIAEPTTEVIIKGPKDAFIENYNANLGLIRKRIKDKNLFFDELKIGKRSNTKIAIGYIDDIIDKSIVEKLKEKLENIDIDGIIDSGNLKELIVTNKKTNFPLIKATERPDIICQALLAGKACIVVENSPFVLIYPTFIIDYFRSSEDYYEKAFNINLTRILRYFCFIITLITPAFYIALTAYNPEIVPDSLLISLAVQREGVPFPTGVEILILAIIFEILRESDVRMPTLMGASISIVGALVLGDAAVNAGIVSPFAVIVIAITSVCALTFTDVDFINAIRWWRLLFMIGAILLGLFGILSIAVILLIHLVNAEEMNIPFMYPIAPFDKNDDIIVKRQNKNVYRGKFTKNIVKARLKNEN